MDIDKSMGQYIVDSLSEHVGHNVEIVNYGETNVTLECLDCNEVITDSDSLLCDES